MGSADGAGGARRRGRPPATDSADTLRTILDAARRLFAERGYGAVTNKELAAAAGLTPAALYHYVESKLDLYVAVHDDMQAGIYDRFQQAEAGADTFLGKLEAVLDTAHDLNEEDPTLARFVGVVRADTRRHDEIRDRLGVDARRRERFFVQMVEAGVRSGEIRPEDRQMVDAFVRTLLVGLTEAVSDSLVEQRRAIDAFKALLRGRLITPVDGR
jgi:AcrR family transcriptional regulator